MARLTVQDFATWPDGQVSRSTPIEPTTAAAAHPAGDEFVNDGRTHLWVSNSSGGAITITFVIEDPCEFSVSHAFAVTVPNNTPGRAIGPFRHARFSADDQLVKFTYSASGLLVGACRFN